MKLDNLKNPFSPLITSGYLPVEIFEEACQTATDNHLPLSWVLIRECGLTRSILRKALAEHYNCPFIEYDERLPVPPELLTCGIKTDQLRTEGWFPLIKEKDGTIVIACTNPTDPSLPAKVEAYLGSDPYIFHVCLPDDITWFTEDYLHAKPGALIGTERTDLAYWRNTLAQWRTLLACYRTDMAKSRTALAITRSGLALITITFAYSRIHHEHASTFGLIDSIMIIGLILGTIGLPAYLQVRRSRLKPPGGQTLMEVTAATMVFLEDFHFVKGSQLKTSTRDTMLARLSDFLGEFCTIFYPFPASRERTHLVRERNVLAAQRTIAACNRTIYARARTGLAFTRTGISFMSIGIGLIMYFGFGLDVIFYGMLILIGLLLAIDGMLWYIPAHQQAADFSKLGTRFSLRTSKVQ